MRWLISLAFVGLATLVLCDETPEVAVRKFVRAAPLIKLAVQPAIAQPLVIAENPEVVVPEAPAQNIMPFVGSQYWQPQYPPRSWYNPAWSQPSPYWGPRSWRDMGGPYWRPRMINSARRFRRFRPVRTQTTETKEATVEAPALPKPEIEEAVAAPAGEPEVPVDAAVDAAVDAPVDASVDASVDADTSVNAAVEADLNADVNAAVVSNLV